MAQVKAQKSLLAVAVPWAAMAIAMFFLIVWLRGDNNLEPAARASGQIEQSNP